MQNRQSHIDVFKIIASQLIVLHHFASYGPIADAASLTAPGMTGWLYDYARMAVQVFLVIGGYLAAQSLASPARASNNMLWRVIARRYQRLILPFLAALLLSVAVAALVRPMFGIDADFIPARPGWAQVLAHMLLIQGIVGSDALSAGVWYVAIDFQLFVLMVCLMWPGRRYRWWQPVARILVLALMLASLFYFNRKEDWDNWALYFFGAYGMGVAACWTAQSKRPGLLLALLMLVGLSALTLAFRERIVIALCVALLLGILQWRGTPFALHAALARPLAALGQASYALFLVHFTVLMLANALFQQGKWTQPWVAAAILLGSVVTSNALALLFARQVEAPLSRWRRHSTSVEFNTDKAAGT